MARFVVRFEGEGAPIAYNGSFVTVHVSINDDGTPLHAPRAWVDSPRHTHGKGKLWRVREVTVTLEPEPEEEEQ